MPPRPTDARAARLGGELKKIHAALFRHPAPSDLTWGEVIALLERLAEVARDHVLRTFDAYVLGENRRMMDVRAMSASRWISRSRCLVFLSHSARQGVTGSCGARQAILLRSQRWSL